jgi:hypothetical protein
MSKLEKNIFFAFYNINIKITNINKHFDANLVMLLIHAVS